MRVNPRTIHLRDQIRAALVDRDADNPATIQALMDVLGLAPARYQEVGNYLRLLARQGKVHRYEHPGDRRVYWGASSELRVGFAIALPTFVVARADRPKRNT